MIVAVLKDGAVLRLKVWKLFPCLPPRPLRPSSFAPYPLVAPLLTAVAYLLLASFLLPVLCLYLSALSVVPSSPPLPYSLPFSDQCGP